jgi:UDP-2-acetamido-3-amino-2,3-dideoxy-glucuronate N-acetyltransferase
MANTSQIHPTAVVDEGAHIGDGVRIWHFCHIMPDASIGEGCILGQNVFVGRGVNIGAGSKVQNNVSVYEGVEIGRRCFIGPSAVFTNVLTPRAEIERKNAYAPTRVSDGATIGANATIVCGNTIGKYAVVGAGAVVTKDVEPHRVVVGVPAREQGWACRCGAVLNVELLCGDCENRYREKRGRLADL